ncbi:Fur family transcriptional regulator [uncultured Pseudacidovorax sp.]|uniref:Fur family transcriptional regulator n=1 Tax=uncultured Pseudacidovorax sp. TaxID=679313 RepID=UPI0025EF77E1|nr:Fur family transcriptional regulator [uncultured Pseudacidovorax sp.]
MSAAHRHSHDHEDDAPASDEGTVPDGAIGTRGTRQRAAIRRVIDESPRPLLPAEILAVAQQEVPALGIATIYRNLKLLLESGAIRTVELPGAVARYESARHAHHHHFQCRRCDRVFDIHACPGDLSGLAPAGFAVEAHELTLYGVCADCGAAAAR